MSGSVDVPLTLGATAADSDGSIAKVEFYDGSTRIDSDTGGPYSLSWTPATAGTHVLTAKATDNKGATTTSAAVNVVVSSANTPPIVSWAVLPATGTVGVPDVGQRVAAGAPTSQRALRRQRLAAIEALRAALADRRLRGGRNLGEGLAMFLVLQHLVVRDLLAGHPLGLDRLDDLTLSRTPDLPGVSLDRPR